MKYNSADPRHVRQATKQAKIDEALDRDVVIALMSNVNGRRWMFNKLTLCHVFQSSHTGNALNTAFQEGERNVGLILFADIMQYAPDQFTEMLRESNARERAADNRRERPAEAGNSDDTAIDRDEGDPIPDQPASG